MVFGAFDWFFILNHFLYSRPSYQHEYVSLYSLNVGGSVTEHTMYSYINGFITMVAKYFRLVGDKTFAEQDYKDGEKIIKPEFWTKKIYQLSQKNGCWMDMFRFASAQKDFIYWGYNNKRLKHHLKTSMKCWIESKGNMLDSGTWKSIAIPNLPVKNINYTFLKVPLSSAIAIAQTEGKTLRLSTPLPFIGEQEYVVIIADKFEAGFDLMFHSAEGLQYSKREMDVVNKFMLKIGEKSVYQAGNSQNLVEEYAWVALWQAARKLTNHIICLVQVDAPIDPTSETQKWVDDNLTHFDES